MVKYILIVTGIFLFSLFFQKIFCFGEEEKTTGSNNVVSNIGCLHYAHQWSTFPCKLCCRAVSLWRNFLWLLCSIENETATSDELIEVMAVSA